MQREASAYLRGTLYIVNRVHTKEKFTDVRADAANIGPHAKFNDQKAGSKSEAPRYLKSRIDQDYARASRG